MKLLRVIYNELTVYGPRVSPDAVPERIPHGAAAMVLIPVW